MKSEVRRIGQQLFAALSEKGLAMLVNHGIADEKVGNLTCIAHKMTNWSICPQQNAVRFDNFISWKITRNHLQVLQQLKVLDEMQS